MKIEIDQWHGRFQDFRLGRAAYCEGAGLLTKCDPNCFKIMADWGGGVALWSSPLEPPLLAGYFFGS